MKQLCNGVPLIDGTLESYDPYGNLTLSLILRHVRKYGI